VDHDCPPHPLATEQGLEGLAIVDRLIANRD
jgi:hypothetical protein